MRPIGDRVIVKLVDQDNVSAGGIHLPDVAREKPQKGKVVAVGAGSRNENGTISPIDVCVSDLVIFGKYSGQPIPGDDKLIVLREEDILAVVD